MKIRPIVNLILIWVLTDALSLQARAATLGAKNWMRVEVPESMRSAPFDVERSLQLPAGFKISVLARVPGARFMALAANGDLLVSQPGQGSISLLRQQVNGTVQVSTFLSGLRKPHDLIFHTLGHTTYLYIAESHRIVRTVYAPRDAIGRDLQVVVANLPDSSTPELKGQYGHELKNIALSKDHRLYVSIASTCNACLKDTLSDPVRGAIYQYTAEGKDRRLYARGLRNAEGLAFVPGTRQLWVVVNNRDNTPYSHNDNSGQYGQVIADYVDNHPPEEFTRVREGANYGWPFCNPNPDTRFGLKRMPFDPDFDLNADKHVDCSVMNRISQGLTAHSAPLGLTFLIGTRFDHRYRNGVVMALHGSWNRQIKSGYEVAYFSWDNTTNSPMHGKTLLRGWLDKTAQAGWGRPVDLAVDRQGNLLISDDYSGTIYKLTRIKS